MGEKENISCNVHVLNDTSQYYLNEFRILSNNVDYHSSTYDKEVNVLKGDEYEHIFKIRIPPRDFRKLLDEEDFKVYINASKLEVEKYVWDRIKQEIAEKKLLIYSINTK